jgi:hypothetical protein
MALPDTDSADAPKGKVRPSGLSLTEERKILKEARARFKEAVDADSDNRKGRWTISSSRGTSITTSGT